MWESRCAPQPVKAASMVTVIVGEGCWNGMSSNMLCGCDPQCSKERPWHGKLTVLCKECLERDKQWPFGGTSYIVWLVSQNMLWPSSGQVLRDSCVLL